MKVIKHTIFDIPVLNFALCSISKGMLRLLGWSLAGTVPPVPKCIIIAAPHTSNWDFVFTLFFAFAFRVKLYMLAKKELVDHPLGFIFTWLGVIPVDRKSSNNVVAQVVAVFNEREQLLLGIAPQGTRSQVDNWKTGFYHIACGAKVPIALGFLDYANRKGGFGDLFYPTGNLEEDLAKIREFYIPIQGKNR